MLESSNAAQTARVASAPSAKSNSLSDEMREVVAYVQLELLRKAKRSTPCDTDYLLALLMQTRRFSRSDALLRALGIPIRQVRQYVSKYWKEHYAQSTLPENREASTLLDESTAIAQTESSRANGKYKTDVHHLLKAMIGSSDPVIRQLCLDHSLTTERIDQAVQKTRHGGFMRNTLFLVREIGEVAFVVLLMLIVIKEGFGELRLIPSESMLPLLQIEDRIVIEKVTRWWRPYQRGDILVFYPPTTILKNDPLSWVLRATGFSGFIFPKESNIDVAYIKRLIGEPGDKIQVVPNEGVFVNGQRLHEPYVMELAQSCTQVLPTQYCGTITVPRDSYFLMGDNRNQSADSRFWGFEPKERVIGRAVFRLWPLNRMGPLSLPEVSQD